MKSSLKLSLVAGLLVAAGLAFSQSPMGGGECDHGMMGQQGDMQGQGRMFRGMDKRDSAKMQAMMDKRQAQLKALLKLTPAQEGAWTAYVQTMKPTAGKMGQRPEMAEMAKLTTPERLEKMKTMRTQHMSDMAATMDKHGEAIKAFYAVLTAEQKKVFDASAMQDHGKMGGARPGKEQPPKP